MPTDQHQFGRDSESRAIRYLLDLGYTIITRNYRVRGGEIDVIALDADTLVFVEVKARATPDFIPEEAVGLEKVESMARAARTFKTRMKDDRPTRFDLVAIDLDGIRHYKGCYGEQWS